MISWTPRRCRYAAFLVLLPLFPPVQAQTLETFTLPGPSGNGGMYYPDLQASFPGVDWTQLDRLYIPADHYRFLNLGGLPERTAEHPLVITNLGGQVRVGGLDFHYNFVIGGGSHWKLTGRWDPDAQTGDASFPGHAGGQYATSRGRYGFLIDDAFEDEGNSGLGIGGGASDFEVEFVEITGVGFAGVLMKTDNAGDATMSNVRFHDNYIHDTGSEGIYFGSTQSPPQHKIQGLKLYNNRIVRTGTEAVQLGQIGGGTEVYNNVFAYGALDWKDPFQAFQDNNAQVGAREGDVSIHHNVFLGGASKFLILFDQSNPGDSHQAGDLVEIRDNVFSHSRHFGVYFHSQADGVTEFRFEGNVFREIDFHYDELYPGETDYNAVFRIFNTANPILLSHNRWDGGQAFVQAAGGNTVASNNSNVSLPPVTFVDDGLPPGTDPFRLEMWAGTSGLTGDPVFYEEGDLVVYLGQLYECIEAGQHTGKAPPDHPGTWSLLPLPVDDLRTAPGSPYRGIGLTDRTTIFTDGFESGNTAAWTNAVAG